MTDESPDPDAQDHSSSHHRHPARNQKHPYHEHHGAGARARNGGARTRTGSAGRSATGSFTLGHAGRQVRLGPVAFWTVVGTLVIMACWSVVTATYFAFHDDLLPRMGTRQAEMQYPYGDRFPH